MVSVTLFDHKSQMLSAENTIDKLSTTPIHRDREHHFIGVVGVVVIDADLLCVWLQPKYLVHDSGDNFKFYVYAMYMPYNTPAIRTSNRANHDHVTLVRPNASTRALSLTHLFEQ